MSGWMRDLVLGARLAVTGGQRSVGRLVLTAVSTGMGVALLLLAASVPTMWRLHGERQSALAYSTAGSTDWPGTNIGTMPPGVDPLYLITPTPQYHETYLDGAYLKAGGPHAPVPPGIDRVPAPGEVYLSPALDKLLRSPEGALLRPRFPERVVGLIGESGLVMPHELRFYAGTAQTGGFGLVNSVYAVIRFGDDSVLPEPLPPILWLMLVVGTVVLLIPVLAVVASAGRVGGLVRDRRLAALRLVGAGVRQTRRIAAGEALAGSLAGVLLGVSLFLAGRAIAPGIVVNGISFFSSDIKPSWPIAAAVLLVGPVLAVQAAMFALRGAIIEPLGVLRQASATRRRLWWRLVSVVFGALLLGAELLAPGVDQRDTTKIVIAVALLLVSIPAMLPWLVERLVGVAPHGSVPYELAVRRLRLDPGAPARLVGGVSVIMAGAIALQTVVLAAQREVSGFNTPRPVAVSQPSISTVLIDASALPAGEPTDPAAVAAVDDLTRKLGAVAGVDAVGRAQVAVTSDGSQSLNRIAIADCGTIVRLSSGARCADGDAFLGSYVVYEEPAQAPPTEIQFANPQRGGPPLRLPYPKQIHTDPVPLPVALVLTPGALHGLHPLVAGVELPLAVTSLGPDTGDELRNVLAPLGWRASLSLDNYTFGDLPSALQQYRTIRTGLLIGVLLMLLLAGASMVALALEQIAERRRPMAVLAASGVPRSVLARSVLWQNLLPMAVALPIALGTGIALGQVLLWVANVRTALVGADWAGVGLLTAAATALVLVTTALTLPALRRATRPTELRAE